MRLKKALAVGALLGVAALGSPVAHTKHYAAQREAAMATEFKLTQAQIQAKELLPTLFPYRAEAALSLQVIETDNPIYRLEKIRQQQTARSYSSLVGLPSEILKF